ncbi:MAG: radical SAM/SPASM domain-containing protein [Promethearchaeota archaeon]|jgi:MoaA/NifB/PqqE/SkfB family radical SAM enzyme
MKLKTTTKEITRQKNELISKLALAAKQAKDTGGRPFIFHFLTTLHCNCDCDSCLWKDNSVKDELTLEEIKRIYLEAREADFFITLLWGGEPTLRRDIADIIKFAKHKADFAFIGMVTNGYLIPKRISEFGDDLDLILISLDSPIQEEHDTIRDLPGLYDKIMESVDLIKREYPHISLQFSFSISKYNIHRVDEMIALGDKLEVPIAFNVINTIRHYSTEDIDEKGQFSATEQEISDAFSRILESKKKGSHILNSEMYLKHFIGGKKPYRCHARKVFMYVNSNGDIEDCLRLDKPIANLRKMSVKKAMKSPRFQEYLRDTENCNSCNSPTMIDTSYVWEDWSLIMKSGGISFG